MKISRFPHYVKKIHKLGPRKTLEMISHRVHSSVFEQYTRYRAEQKKASHTWPVIASRYDLGSFSYFLQAARNRNFSFAKELVTQVLDEPDLLRQADAFAYNCFDILGSREQCLMVLPWHSDFRLRYQNPDADYLFDKNKFYKDFTIQPGLTDRLVKDIKVPWELARFQQVFVLGAAYQKTKNPVYVRAFMQQTTSFIDENPYLLGPNWVCPMDVALRALNWVWAFELFKQVPEIPVSFWEKYMCSLYDHMNYLEHNWEVYERTSNHYVSDLVGYFYLAFLFQDLRSGQKKLAWVHKEILKECEKQVFDEGTDYEGSTNYHRLVTELFYHAYLMMQESGFSVPEQFITKLRKMFVFIDWCTVSAHTMLNQSSDLVLKKSCSTACMHGCTQECSRGCTCTGVGLVKIGDDDSGQVLFYGITSSLVTQMCQTDVNTQAHKQTHKQIEPQAFFKDFGLAIYKTTDWHVTLRHVVYTHAQPSGHFHNDVGSITVAVNGIPIIVDPGSYVYTPSAVWRNRFRSITMHNSFFIEGTEPTDFSDQSLFVLDLPERNASDDPWVVRHDLYTLPAQRSVTIQDTVISIEDRWLEVPQQTLQSVWNFTLAPGIDVQHVQTEKSESSDLIVVSGTKRLLSMSCPDVEFSIKPSWFSPAYGVKVACKKLVARCLLTTQPTVITLRRV